MYGKNPYIAILFPTGLIDTTVVRLHVRVQLAETGEIYIIEQNRASLVHCLEVEFSRNLIDQFIVERIFSCRDIIFISTRSGIEPSMRIGTNRYDTVDRDIFGKQTVQLLRQKNEVVNRFFPIEMSHHQAGMYAGIRPPRSHNGDRLAQ